MRLLALGTLVCMLFQANAVFAEGACCRPSGVCEVVTNPLVDCGPGYQGDNSTCTVGLCPVPTGACCLPTADADCQVEEPLVCEGLGGVYKGNSLECSEIVCSVVVTPFVDALPIPPIAQPTSGDVGGTASYALALVTVEQKLHRDLPPSTVWAIDDGSGAVFPGPTIEASPGNQVDITWLNDLRGADNALLEAHSLDVDVCYPGAVAGPPQAAMTVQGAHAASPSSGMPDEGIWPGQQWDAAFANEQPAATLWYRDRALGTSHLSNYLGLAGLYLLRDATGPALPTGAQDVPLILQDRTIDGDGVFVYPDGLETTSTHSIALVNGKVWPYLDVARGTYRFRIVNASGGRTFLLSLSDGIPMTVIGNDLGLVPRSTIVDQVLVSPGERVEVLADFSELAAGTEVVLSNAAPAPFPGYENQGVIRDVLKFVVGATTAPTIFAPDELADIETLAPETAREERTFVLSRNTGSCSPFVWDINGASWGDTIVRPSLGATELWHLANTSIDTHPMHIDAGFQIVEKRAFEMVDGAPVAFGQAFPLGPAETGWKDTVRVPPGQLVTIALRFEDFQGRFAYHSNIYEHADNAMAGQFIVSTQCGDGFVGAPEEACDDGEESAACNADCSLTLCGDGYRNELSEACDDGNLDDGDGCSSDCQFDVDGGEPMPVDSCGCKTGSGSTGALPVFVFFLLLSFVRRRGA